jgi:hypothetical protein
MREFSDLEVNEDITPEDAVVEDEVHIEMVGIEGEPFLPGFKEKSFAEFREKYFQFIDDGGFEIAFGIVRILIKPEKFKNIGIFEHILRISDDLSFICKGFYPLFVPAECEPFVDTGVELPFELRK